MQYSIRSMKISIIFDHLHCKSNLTKMSRDTLSSGYFYSLIDDITYNMTHYFQFKVENGDP